jgi:solute:Na+ symporter, SSS family
MWPSGMLAAKDEKNAIGATLLFNFLHYAIRPWPWIVVALASLVVFQIDEPAVKEEAKRMLDSPEWSAKAQIIAKDPGNASVPEPERRQLLDWMAARDGVSSIRKEFPDVHPQYLKQDIGYPAMISKLGPGWLGLVVASLIAAYMSTIGTHLNWGSSYVVNDFYRRFVRPDASEKQLVGVGRICTALLMICAGALSLTILENATDAFNILLLAGAGSGAIYLLRWFWWRINAWSEISAMAVTTVLAVYLVKWVDPAGLALKSGEETLIDGGTMRFIIAVAATTLTWVVATFVTPPEDPATLREFVRKIKPGGPGWKRSSTMPRGTVSTCSARTSTSAGKCLRRSCACSWGWRRYISPCSGSAGWFTATLPLAAGCWLPRVSACSCCSGFSPEATPRVEATPVQPGGRQRAAS